MYNFSDSKLIGQGGFADVYKGERNCQEFAIKRLLIKEKLTGPDIELADKFFETYLTELKVLHDFPARNILALMAISYTDDLSTGKSYFLCPILFYSFSIFEKKINK